MKEIIEKLEALHGEYDELFQDGIIITLAERERLLFLLENIGEAVRETNYIKADGKLHMHLMALVEHPELFAEQVVRIRSNPYLNHLM